jgi:hypothetical protein
MLTTGLDPVGQFPRGLVNVPRGIRQRLLRTAPVTFRMRFVDLPGIA